MSDSGEGLEFLLGVVLAVLVAPVGLLAVYFYYRGEDRAEREAARERESAVLREAAGAPNFNYLLALVWARWRGLTRRDRRAVQAMWIGLSLMFLVMVSVSGSVSDVGSLVGAIAVLPFVLAIITLALIFRMR
jgi:hypothetical protein